MSRMRIACALLLAACLQAADPAFETAVVKANKSGDRQFTLGPPSGGRFSTRNAPLAILIREAWHLHDFQLSGPAWLATERYDITAKAEGNPSGRQMLAMLQSLLLERFAMKVHHETREMPVYMLTVARGGLKMVRSEEVCPDKPVPGHPCGGLNIRKTGLLAGYNVRLEQLTEGLGFILGRMVIDKTGLQDNFNVDIRWTPDEFNAETGVTAPSGDGNGPSL